MAHIFCHRKLQMAKMEQVVAAVLVVAVEETAHIVILMLQHYGQLNMSAELVVKAAAAAAAVLAALVAKVAMVVVLRLVCIYITQIQEVLY